MIRNLKLLYRFKATTPCTRAALSALVALSFACAAYAAEGVPPHAERGVLDLRAWNFDRDGPVRLSGEWEFYWHVLPGPEGFATRAGAPAPLRTGYSRLPHSWTGDLVNGQTLPGSGYATYRLRVLLPQGLSAMAVSLESAGTAYALTVDGRQVLANGRVGDSPNSSRPEYRNATADLGSLGEESEWILAVSNFDYRKGGPWSPIWIGTAAQLRAKQMVDTGLELFLIGCVLIMGLYHLAIFSLLRRDRLSFAFALFCLVVALRQASTGQRFLLELGIPMPWQVLIRIEFVSFFLCIVLAIAFLYTLFPEPLSRWVAWGTAVAAAAASVFALVAPPRLSSEAIVPYEMLTLAAGAYTLFALVRAALRRQEGALLMLFGATALVAAGLNDTLYNLEIFRFRYFLSMGLVVLISSQAILLARRYARAIVTAETLSRHLEVKVEERTQELAVKNQDLEQTITDLRTAQGHLRQVGLPVRIGADYHVFPYTDILYLSSKRGKTLVHSRNQVHEVPRAVKEIEPLLSAETFLRIHRTCIVNVDQVAQIAHIGGGGYIAVLRDTGQTVLPVSRYLVDTLKKRLGIPK